jgi:hypothetical protein
MIASEMKKWRFDFDKHLHPISNETETADLH